MPHKGAKKSVPSSSSSDTTDTADEDLLALVSKTYESPQHFKNELDIYYNNQVKKLEESLSKNKDSYSKLIDGVLQSLPESVLNLLLVGVLEDDQKHGDQNLHPNLMHSPKGRHSRSQQVQEPEFKVPRALSDTRRGSRQTSRKRSVSVSDAPPPVFTRTPSSSKKPFFPLTVTPKVNLNAPVSMKRRPLNSEIALSIHGSPLMCGSVPRDDIPTVTVPLGDGRVFSIAAEGTPGENSTDIPEWDEETKKYLKTLRQHLEILAPSP